MSLTPHRKRFEGQGHARYLTFSCFRRQPLLAIDEPCHWMIEAIAATQAKYPFDLWAWVIMPEHVHLLMRPAEGQTVASIQQCLKQSVARRVLSWSRKHRPQMLEDMLDRQPNCTHTHRFWQRGGGYDRNLWTVSEIHQKISYMHEIGRASCRERV